MLVHLDLPVAPQSLGGEREPLLLGKRSTLRSFREKLPDPGAGIELDGILGHHGGCSGRHTEAQ